MVETFKEYDNFNQNDYIACRLTAKGEKWILENQSQLEFRKKPSDITKGDDLPF
jgi:hypothetical protein